MKKIALTIFCCCYLNFISANSDKFRLILTDDPATTITIAWNQISGLNYGIYYDSVDHGTDHTLYANFQAPYREMTFKGMENKFVKLTGLAPNTNYYFIVYDDLGISARYWFKTATNDLSRLSIIAGGDSRNNRIPRQNGNKLVSKLKPHAVLFGGDMTNTNDDVSWQEWFDDWQLTIAADARMFPIIPARGNHEIDASTIYNLFDTPSVDQYYAITFGDNLYRAYTLNSEITEGGAQAAWLEADLQTQTNVIWKSAQYHKPMRPHTAAKLEGNAEYTAWSQLFYDYGLRLVLESDSHMVKSTWGLRPSTEPGNEEGFVRDVNGTVYIGEGCWGAPTRPADDDKTWTRNSDSFNQFKWIFIDEDKIEARTINTDNADLVGEVTNDNVFTAPANLNIWNPSNGAVVELFTELILIPSIAFENSGETPYYDANEMVTLTPIIEDPGSGLTSMEFYINGDLTYTDSVAPFEFSNAYADGRYDIEAIAITSNGQTDNAMVSINVGNYSENLQIPVFAGSDDAEENEAGEIDLTNGDLDLVHGGGNNGYQTIGIRFQHINVPINATINNAYIQFTAKKDESNTSDFLIYIEDTANAVTYTSNLNDISSRNTLSMSEPWIPNTWVTDNAGIDEQTPDLKNLVQAIVSRNDWASGNSIAFTLKGTGVSLTSRFAKRESHAFEAGNEPVLVISYTFNGAPLQTNEFENTLFNIVPNPFESDVTISLPERYHEVQVVLYDILGREKYSQKLVNEGRQVTFNPNIQTSGVYFLVLKDDTNKTLKTKKLIKK